MTYFGIYGHSTNSLYQTTNGGSTWQQIYPKQLIPYPLNSEVTGSGNILFAEQIYNPQPQYGINSIGVIRSIDLGATWDTIAGPHASVHSHLSAVARGSICYAGDDSGRLWKFIDSSLLRNATSDLTIAISSNALSHDTIFSQTCDSSKLILHYGFLGGDYVKLNGIIVEGISASDYRADFIKDKILMTLRPDTSSVTFLPSLPGTYQIKIHTSLLRDDWVREDTAINFVLVVHPNSPIIEALPKTIIDFGKQFFAQRKSLRIPSLPIISDATVQHVQSITSSRIKS